MSYRCGLSCRAATLVRAVGAGRQHHDEAVAPPRQKFKSSGAPVGTTDQRGVPLAVAYALQALSGGCGVQLHREVRGLLAQDGQQRVRREPSPMLMPTCSVVSRSPCSARIASMAARSARTSARARGRNARPAAARVADGQGDVFLDTGTCMGDTDGDNGRSVVSTDRHDPGGP